MKNLSGREKIKVLFQSIGVLTGFNLELVSKLSEYDDLEITLETPQLVLLSHAIRRKVGKGGKFQVRVIRSPLRIIPFYQNFETDPVSKISDKLYDIYSKKFNIIHLNSYKDWIWKKIKHPRKIFTVHGAGEKQDKYPQISSIFQNCSKVVAISNYVRREINKNTSFSPSKVIPHGVNTSLFQDKIPRENARKRLGLSNEEFVVLWNGVIAPHKDLLTFLKAAKRVCEQIEEVTFYIKGRSPDENYLKKIKKIIRKNEKLKDKTILNLDWLPYSQLPILYRAADVLAHSSLYEGFGLVLLEAMACRTPVIAANSTTSEEIIGDAGVLFEPENHEELAENLISLICRESVRNKLADEAKKRIFKKGFTWKDIAREYYSLYQKMM